MLGGADNPNGELPSYITGADIQGDHKLWPQSAGYAESAESELYAHST